MHCTIKISSFFVCLCFGAFECQNIPQFKGAGKGYFDYFFAALQCCPLFQFPQHIAPLICPSHSDPLPVSPLAYRSSRILLQLLTNHLKIVSHHLLLEQTPLRCGQPPSCHCSPRSHVCCFLILVSDVKVNLKQEEMTNNAGA